MSLISAIRGFFGVEPKKDDLKKETLNKNASDVANLPQLIATGKVSSAEGHSGQNSAQGDSGGTDNFTSTIRKDVDIDVKKLAKQYKKNPLDALKDSTVDREYTAEETEELSKLLENKTDLQNYFELAKKGNLSGRDIVAGMKEIAANKKNFLFIKWNKLDEEKLAKDMSDIKNIRETFSSDNIAKTSTIMNLKEELEAKIKHYLAKKEIYNDESALEAINYMDKNTEKADEFYSNTQKLECITGSNNVPKYNGNTIVKTGIYATENTDVADTIWQLARKEDMTNDYLTKTLDNLINNKDMKDALSEFLGMKDNNGNDRFSAKNIFDQSTYMTDKDIETIEKYLVNTKDLAKYSHLSGTNIVKMSNNITTYPQYREQVMEIAANETIPGDTAATMSTKIVTEGKTTSQAANSSKSTGSNTASTLGTKYAEGKTETQSNPATTVLTSIAEIQKEKQEKILRAAISNESDIQEILTLTQENPALSDKINKLLDKIPSGKVADIVKKYSDPKKLELYCTNPHLFDRNPDLLEKFAKNPAYFEKLKFYASVRDSQLVDFAQYLNSSKKEKVFNYFENHYNSTKVLSMLSSTNTEEQNNRDRILQNNLISNVDKKDAIERLQSGDKMPLNQLS